MFGQHPTALEEAAALPGPSDIVDASPHTGRETSPIAVLMELIERYGDVVRYHTRYATFTLVNHPALVRDVLHNQNLRRGSLIKSVLGEGLLSSDGLHWERQRRLMMPDFKPKRMYALLDRFRDVTVSRSATWPAQPGRSVCVDVTHEMNRIALSNIGWTLFDAELDDRFLDAFSVVMAELGAIQNSAMFGFPLVRGPDTNRAYRAALQVLEETVAHILDDAHDGPPHAPLLWKLQGRRAAEGLRPLTRQQMRDEVLTMITAGHETTAVTLAWTLLAVASRPHVAQRLHEEVDDVIGSRPIAADDLPRLKYTRMIIDETLRLYPPVWVVARTAVCDESVGEYSIPDQSGVLVSPFALHRHRDFWPEPERFDPERFDPDRIGRGTDAQDAYSYLPFLAGRHLCIGKYFALTEAVVVLATLAQRFRFHRIDETPVEFLPQVSLRMRHNLSLEVESRPDGGW